MNKNGIVLSCLTSAILMGCGGDDSGTASTDTSSATASTYSFIDEAVKGLYYKTATQAGCTDENGNYKAISTESVEFYIGVCDESNNPTLTNNSVMIGLVDKPQSTTTPYNLQISSSNTSSVNPIAVATILKSFNFSSDVGKLDLSGLLLNENGVDLRNTLKNLIESPTTDTTTVLDATLFGNIALANRDITPTFKHSAFLSEATVKSELVSTLAESGGADIFSVDAIAGKTVVASDGTVMQFSSMYTSNDPASYFASSGKVTVSGIDYSVDWGIYGSFGGSSDAGDLRINDGAKFDKKVSAVNIGKSNWVVKVNGGSNEIWVVK
ncbi:hypothetical protein M3924_003885 [Vibrio fluvialis]|uniref:hypothetical protein n=1 Tax=Vibrio fluvialis TaxID=676 RepID=UPI000A416B56|nr:hypothetical protein [Vibrio fluvialis]EKO3488199.1 hypothetical protein [Vibrio fluvialis]MBY7898590.1 hypothetical protein [Vibrio fluvialis]